MRNVYRWMWVLGMVASLISFALVRLRTGSIVGTSDELITSTQALVTVLQSVRDSASAQAATKQINEKYKRVQTLSEDLISSAKSADRFGGVSKQGKEQLIGRMEQYGSLMQQCNGEVERIKGLRGLPLEFWNVLRSQLAKTLRIWAEVAARSYPESAIKAVKFRAEMIEEFGPARVVEIETPGMLSEKASEIMKQLTAKIGSAAKAIIAAADSEPTILIGPVDDFEKFVAGIDSGMGVVADKDAGQRMIEIRTNASPVEPQASLNAAPPSNEAAAASEPIGRPQSFSDAAENAQPKEQIDPAALARERAAREQQRLEERGFPNSADPEYHKKLCDLMVDSSNWTLNDEAIDAVLKIEPLDIQDKAVRNQIARNFRDLARDRRAGNDQAKAIRGLVRYGGKYSVPVLIEILEDATFGVPDALFDGLASFPDPRGAEALSQQLGSHYNHNAAITALRTMGPMAEDALLKVAPADDAKVSLAAVQLLGEFGTKKSLPLLGKAAKSRNQDVRAAAKEAVKSIVERSRATVQ